MPANVKFNPEKVAYYEKAGWEAYYDRQWLRCFRLLVQLNRGPIRNPQSSVRNRKAELS